MLTIDHETIPGAIPGAVPGATCGAGTHRMRMTGSAASGAMALALMLAGATPAAAGCGAEAGACSVPGGSYHVALPLSADTDPAAALTEAAPGTGAAPILLVLHDTGGDAAALAEAPALAATARARGFAVLAPVGQPQILADGTTVAGWHLAGTGTGGRDEVSFITRITADAAARFGLDATRVLVTGYGHGGSLAWQIACDAPWTASAYAPRNGGFHAPMPEGCVAPGAPLLHLHAPEKDGWPLTGAAPGADGDTALPVPAQAQLSMLAASRGCTANEAVTAGLPESWNAVEWTGCAAGAPMGLVLHGERSVTTTTQLDLVLDWFAALAPAPADLVADADDETAVPAVPETPLSTALLPAGGDVATVDSGNDEAEPVEN
ncbi:MAG: PHB depolymerase family esterase [Pseudomonadota bacterium]